MKLSRREEMVRLQTLTVPPLNLLMERQTTAERVVDKLSARTTVRMILVVRVAAMAAMASAGKWAQHRPLLLPIGARIEK